MSITNIASQTTFQTLGGLLIGSSIDKFFDELDGEIDNENFVKVLGESLLQLGVISFISAAYFDFIGRRFNVRGEDPTKGISFMLSLMGSQPNLTKKLSSLSNFVKDFLKQYYISGNKIKSKNIITKPGYITQNLSSENPDNQHIGEEDEKAGYF